MSGIRKNVQQKESEVIPMYDELIIKIRQLQHWFKPNESDSFEPYKILGEAVDAIEELQTQLRAEKVANVNLTGWLAEEHAKHLWIPVTERLPKDRQRVLAISLSKISPRRLCYRLVYFSNNLESVDNLDFEGESRCGFYYYDSEYGFCEVDDVTHWMPLPQPPEDDEEQAKEESEQIYKAYDSKAVKTGIKAFPEPPESEESDGNI